MNKYNNSGLFHSNSTTSLSLLDDGLSPKALQDLKKYEVEEIFNANSNGGGRQSGITGVHDNIGRHGLIW